ncbi:MAG: DUF2878 domain-containing protein [Candidatus Marinimicrobia bacterium]|nr:DUF2878 domain-containing protein [Candidatus Neomarinimicrobiota bacterium]MCF7921147.1 DUF2878 domain-containing protein [Candidatus Neomarinimicrobiota bacterium]
MNTKTETLKIGFNALGFQSAWWLSVLGIVAGYPWLGPLVMTLYLVADHYSFTKGKPETLLILSAMLAGTMADSIFSASGLLSYGGGYSLAPALAPLWITAMWGGFAATLNHSLGWLKNKPLLAFALGAIFGPLSYMAGAKFDAIVFNQSFGLTVIILGLFWGLAIPGLIQLNTYLERRASS